MSYFKLLFFLILLSNVVVLAGNDIPIRTDQGVKIKQYLEGMQQGNDDSAIKDDWIKPDKGLHLIGSMICFLGSANSLQRFAGKTKNNAVLLGGSFTFSLGVAKELRDKSYENNIFSFKDLLADLVGIGIGLLIINLD